jgi:hypothetical protein
VRIPKPVKGVNFAQLLKHILGLKHRCGIGSFRLVYLWYAAPSSELGQHFEQLEEFQEVLNRDGIKFHPVTYQDLISRLAISVRQDHQLYIDYLTERYL